MNEKLTEARQLLAAAGWCLSATVVNNKVVYTVLDSEQTPRRSFIPVGRLWDYARGVFDAQEFNGGSK